MAEEPHKTTGPQRAVLVLEDGTVFEGRSLGASGERVGEVCFNTSMTGYQEIMSDPSYCGQIVTMTYSQIGNTGITSEDMESGRPWIRGFVIKESSRIPSNWRSQETLGAFLRRHDVVAIEGIDTRALTTVLREKGAQRGVLSTESNDHEALQKKAQAWPGLAGMDLTGEVTCAERFDWNEGLWKLDSGYETPTLLEDAPRVAALDFGIKRNILRSLVSVGCRVQVFPASTDAKSVLEWNPDGIFLSNGPGDPDAVKQGIATIQELLKTDKPVFGICLGHQMLCLALGGQTKKMKFGHRGGNHPVQNLASKQVEVTAQNHGFVVDESCLPEGLEVTHRSLFDGSVEGVRHRVRPIFSVQYHPEASPGPHDAHYLFRQFADLMRP
ncbi:glutamine-hydrolyzing carbamoyl-phosphate synthase small subunit [Magnetococcales bacterium HHB-1]